MTRLRKKNGREKPWRLKYICMGNEWWFYETAQGYAEDYRRYSQFAREYGDNKLVRLLRGPQHFPMSIRTSWRGWWSREALTR